MDPHFVIDFTIQHYPTAGQVLAKEIVHESWSHPWDLTKVRAVQSVERVSEADNFFSEALNGLFGQ